LANVSKAGNQKPKRVFPFATVSIDVLKLYNPENTSSLQLFGSYAQTDNFGDQAYTQQDFNPDYDFFSAYPTAYSVRSVDSSFWIWQAGANLQLLNKRIGVQYNFERRNYTTEVALSMPGTVLNYVMIYPDIISSTHYIRVTGEIMRKPILSWFSGITMTSIKSKASLESINGTPFPGHYVGTAATGDFNSDHTSWTGGWVNRFTYKKLSAGLDLLYYFSPDIYGLVGPDTKAHAVSLQNIYVGYQVDLKGTKGLEVYADCRGLAQHSWYKISEPRKYYGLGVKASL
jgi:hypothetical protein